MDSLFNRLAAGPGNLQQNDYNQWSQTIGSAPPDQFGQATYNAMQQISPQDYYAHTQPGVGGTDPFGMLAPQARSGLAQTLLSSLFNHGANPQQVAQASGMGGAGQIDPSQLSPAQLAALTQYAHQNYPQAFGQVAQQYQSQPDILHSLLGNKALMMVVAGLGAKYLSDRQMGR